MLIEAFYSIPATLVTAAQSNTFGLIGSGTFLDAHPLCSGVAPLAFSAKWESSTVLERLGTTCSPAGKPSLSSPSLHLLDLPRICNLTPSPGRSFSLQPFPCREPLGCYGPRHRPAVGSRAREHASRRSRAAAAAGWINEEAGCCEESEEVDGRGGWGGEEQVQAQVPDRSSSGGVWGAGRFGGTVDDMTLPAPSLVDCPFRFLA
jgi:hypothetical protein